MRAIVVAGFLVVGLLLGALPAEGRAQTPTFELELEPCPGSMTLPLDTRFTREIGVYITASDNSGDDGAQGWGLSLSVNGVEPIGITTEGTVAEEVLPPGVFKAAFVQSFLADCADSKGVVLRGVLSLTEDTSLPPRGPSLVGRLTIEGRTPAFAGEPLLAEIGFEDGCRPATGGQSVVNTITWRGESVRPIFGAPCRIVVLGTEAPVFLRGDPNEDRALDISDPIQILYCLFLGEGCPTCPDAGDMNDDGTMDISDAIHGLGFLFTGSRPPDPPGHETCGPDSTEDTLGACDYASCEG